MSRTLPQNVCNPPTPFVQLSNATSLNIPSKPLSYAIQSTTAPQTQECWEVLGVHPREGLDLNAAYKRFVQHGPGHLHSTRPRASLLRSASHQITKPGPLLILALGVVFATTGAALGILTATAVSFVVLLFIRVRIEFVCECVGVCARVCVCVCVCVCVSLVPPIHACLHSLTPDEYVLPHSPPFPILIHFTPHQPRLPYNSPPSNFSFSCRRRWTTGEGARRSGSYPMPCLSTW